MDKTIHALDIRNDVCPMTFVKTRLLIERMPVGDVASILLRGAEPIENVPASVAELGHTVLDMAPVRSADDRGRRGDGRRGDGRPGDMRLRFRKE